MMKRSNWWSCLCGFDHDLGCKVKITERLVTALLVVVGVGAFWYWLC